MGTGTHPARLPAGPFTRAEAEALGVTRAQLAAMTATGGIRQVLRGVYAQASLRDSLPLRARAAALVVTPSHVLVDRTAAWLLGVDAFSWSELEALPPIEAIAIRGNAPSRRAGIDAGSRALREDDITRVNGIAATTPLRTSMDLGCRLKRREAYAVMNSFATLHSVESDEINSQLARFAGRRGVIQLRELTRYLDPRVESPRESWVLLALIDANLHRPEAQHVVAVGTMIYRIDFAYVRARVAVEYDGEDHHSSPDDAAYDRQRRRDLERMGWRFVIVRNGDFTADRLNRWTTQVRDLLEPVYRNRRW